MKTTNSKIGRAAIFGGNAHLNQKYGSELYMTHLKSVHDTLLRYGIEDEDILIASFLHDTIEDTEVSYNDIKEEFGYNVAELVYRVTDELGRNRRERHHKTYPKIIEDPKAIILKLADRIANVEASRRLARDERSKSKFSMYRKEYQNFRAILLPASPPEAEKMWESLDELLEYNSDK